MSRYIDRRDFLKAAALSAGLASSIPGLAQHKRNLKIGHTGITWAVPPAPRPAASDGTPPAGRRSGGPRRIDPVWIEQICKQISGPGFYGLEVYSCQAQVMQASCGMAQLA